MSTFAAPPAPPGVIEEWRQVIGYPGFYVSNLGRVANRHGALKKLTPRKADGYLCVGFWQNDKTTAELVHRVVCRAFHGAPPTDRHEVAHGDGSRTNNRAANLRWATRAENSADKYEHGTHLQGDDCPWSKLTKADVEEIRRAPKRVGECARLAARFGVTENHIAKIRTRSRGIWPDVPFDGGARA